MRRRGYRAGKFGWSNFGHGTVQSDIEQVRAAREGLGKDGILLIDAGTQSGLIMYNQPSYVLKCRGTVAASLG